LICALLCRGLKRAFLIAESPIHEFDLCPVM